MVSSMKVALDKLMIYKDMMWPEFWDSGIHKWHHQLNRPISTKNKAKHYKLSYTPVSFTPIKSRSDTGAESEVCMLFHGNCWLTFTPLAKKIFAPPCMRMQWQASEICSFVITTNQSKWRAGSSLHISHSSYTVAQCSKIRKKSWRRDTFCL